MLTQKLLLAGPVVGGMCGAELKKNSVVKEEEVKQDENLEEGKECEQGVRRHNKMTHKKKEEGNRSAPNAEHNSEVCHPGCVLKG